MNTLDRMIIRQFLPTLLVAVMFFVLILEMVDLFANLWRYIDNETPLMQIVTVFILYIPKCISFSIPMALLFAVSYTLGNFYSNNELIAVFGSGVPLFRFVLPLIFAGLILSVFSFAFEENLVIETYKMKNDLSNQMLRRSESLNNSNPTVIDENGRVIYSADFYNDNETNLTNLTLIERDVDGNLIQSLSAEYAKWNEEKLLWEFNRCRIYALNSDSGFYEIDYIDKYTNVLYDAAPFTFRKVVRDVEEMQLKDASMWIEALQKAGLPYREALTAYYKRFSFALTPFIVSLLSAAIGGRFRKNILLMSLLTSLIISVVYYVMQMVLVILANLGYISPAAGAWSPFIFFCILGFFAYRWSHS